MSESVFIKLVTFAMGWTGLYASVQAGVEAPRLLETLIVVDINGTSLSIIPAIAAIIGVLSARPLAPKKDPPLSMVKNILVTFIMLMVALLWVLESQPRTLFAFAISIGLGFSGYSLIELMGAEIKDFIKRIFSIATGFLDKKDKS